MHDNYQLQTVDVGKRKRGKIKDMVGLYKRNSNLNSSVNTDKKRGKGKNLK